MLANSSSTRFSSVRSARSKRVASLVPTKSDLATSRAPHRQGSLHASGTPAAAEPASDTPLLAAGPILPCASRRLPLPNWPSTRCSLPAWFSHAPRAAGPVIPPPIGSPARHQTRSPAPRRSRPRGRRSRSRRRPQGPGHRVRRGRVLSTCALDSRWFGPIRWREWRGRHWTRRSYYIENKSDARRRDIGSGMTR
jgi:hypothetical protein